MTQVTERPKQYTPDPNYPPVHDLRDKWNAAAPSAKMTVRAADYKHGQLVNNRDWIADLRRQLDIAKPGTSEADRLTREIQSREQDAAGLEKSIATFNAAERRALVLEILGHEQRIMAEYKTCCAEMNSLARYEREHSLSSTEADRLRWLRGQYQYLDWYVRELPALREEIPHLLPKSFTVRVELVNRAAIAIRDLLASAFGETFVSAMRAAADHLDSLVSKYSSMTTTATWAELEAAGNEPIALDVQAVATTAAKKTLKAVR